MFKGQRPVNLKKGSSYIYILRLVHQWVLLTYVISYNLKVQARIKFYKI